MRRGRPLLGGVLLVLLVLAGFLLFDLEPSHRAHPPAVEVSGRALALHRDALVIDLHVDSLLWQRNLLERSNRGQLDFPRMREGGLDAAAFTLSTRFFGLAGLKAFHDLWPPSTWFSPWARLRHQVEKADGFLAASAGKVRRATTASEIRQNHRQGILSIFHGIEGAHALGRESSRVKEAAAAGVVFMGPVHLSDNEYGGSSSGSDRGLTDLGRQLILKMNEVRVLVDLAHASEKTFAEALALTAMPPLVSHTGARAVHDTWRNLSDDQIRAVAERGGVIGVMLGPPALSQPDLKEAFRHLKHMVSIAGEDAVGLGSDFDGYIETPIDAAGLPQLTELMLREGWSEERIRKILGENVLRVLGSR